jgi:hypothetical protein
MRASHLAAAAALSALTACSSTEPTTIASVAFTSDAVTMVVDDVLATPALVTNSRGAIVSNATVTYTSSNESVAAVSSQGSLQALAEGTTTITGTINGLTDQLQVTVVMPTVKKVELSIDTVSVLTDVVTVSAAGVAQGMRTRVATVLVKLVQ